jgi:hypothetical protein
LKNKRRRRQRRRAAIIGVLPGTLSLFLTEVSFDTSEEKQLSYFQKLIFFENSLMIS